MPGILLHIGKGNGFLFIMSILAFSYLQGRGNFLFSLLLAPRALGDYEGYQAQCTQLSSFQRPQTWSLNVFAQASVSTLSSLQMLWTDQRVATFWARPQKPIGVWYNGIKGDSYHTCLSEQGRQLVSKAWLALSSASPHISHRNKPALAPQSPCLP